MNHPRTHLQKKRQSENDLVDDTKCRIDDKMHNLDEESVCICCPADVVVALPSPSKEKVDCGGRKREREREREREKTRTAA
jgi:hypothetical protein